MNATRAQIAKIHIAKKQLGIDEEDYRNHLCDFGVEHANELSYEHAKAFIAMYEGGGFNGTVKIRTEKEIKSIEQYGFGKRKYDELDDRGKPFAAASKLRKIEALWREVSRTKTDESLQIFIKNRTGVDHITFLHDKHAKIILTALEAMKKCKTENARRETNENA